MFKKMMAKRLPAGQTTAGDDLDISTQLSNESVSQSSPTPLSQTSPYAKRTRTEAPETTIETPAFLKSKVAPSAIKEPKHDAAPLKRPVQSAGPKEAAMPQINRSTSSSVQQATTTTTTNPSSSVPLKRDSNKSQITRYHLRQMIAWNKTLDGLGDIFQNLIRVLDADPSRFCFYCLLCHHEFSATTSRNAIRFASDHVLEKCTKQGVDRKNRSEVEENVADLTEKMQELEQRYQKLKKAKTKSASKSSSRKEEDLMKGLLHHRNQVVASYIKSFCMETKLDLRKERQVSMVKSYLKDVLEQDCAFEDADLDDMVTRLQRRHRCT